ncbi:MAG TPA: tetratricopeptide repeat protein [Candidatus Latescibacteria bacterium]|nr:tetratricopeptide repeat protein [Candidatus Handelsmanbacteria bacterium]HIL10623.1 tetratricopeptide repeat protein [Candidatus Latescibacterota bacterium]
MTNKCNFWLVYTGLLCLTAWLCFGNLHTHLLDTHDAEAFRDHLRIEQDLLFFFGEKEQASGRPFAEAVKYLAFLIFGNDPAAFHLLVVAMHTLAAWLLARVVWQQGGESILAGLAGLLFLVNVTHFQAVHHISALDYPLALCCGLLGILALGKRAQAEHPTAFAASLALGVLAHPSIAVAWLLAFYLLWQRYNNLLLALRALWPSGLLLAAAFFAAVQLAAKNTSTWQSIDSYGALPIWDLVLGMVRVLWWFCGRLLTTAHWLPLPIYLQQTWELYLGAVVFALLFWLIWRHKDPLRAAALATLIGLFPFLLLTEATILGLPAGPSRYLYLASAGSSLLIAAALDWTRRHASPYLAGGLALLILISSYHGLKQAEAISLYTAGRSYSASGQYATAREQFHRALAQAPEALPAEDVYIRLCLLTMDSEDDPVPVLEKALATLPASKNLRLLQLAIDAMLPSAEFSEKAMQLALDLRYTTTSDAEIVAKALHNLGAGFLKKKDPTTAIRAYEQTLRIDPDRFKTLKDLTFARWQRAAALIDEMEAADRDHGAKQVAELRQQIHLALDNSRHALRLRTDADLYYAMGRIYQYQQRLGDALTAYEQTLKQDPAYRRAYQRMAEIFALQGDLAAADRILQALSEHTGTPAARSER